MPTTAAAAPPRDLRRARLSVALLFGTNGAVFANLPPRYPQLKADLGLNNAGFGTAIAAYPLAALLAGLAAGALVHRFRSSRVAVTGTVVMSVGLAVAGLSGLTGSWLLFSAALFVAGGTDAVVDVAMNAHGLRVQRRYGRSIFNSFHAVWSGGFVVGGLTGAAAAGLGVPPGVHLAVSGAVLSGVALLAHRGTIPGPEDADRAPDPVGAEAAAPASRRRLPTARLGVLLALSLLATCGTLTEDAGSSWSALYLRGDLAASAAVAGLGVVALQGFQLVGRVFGDRLVDRFGERAVARTGGSVTAVGMGAALAAPTTVTTVLGLGLAGLGVATLVPAALHAADELPGLAPGVGLTVVSWLMRVGFLVSPPLVGLVADASSLRVGLLVVPLAGVGAVVLARFLAPRRPG